MGWDAGVVVGIIGIVIATAALVMAIPPFLDLVCGKPSIRLSFADSAEQGAKFLLGRIDNRPIMSAFLKAMGITRADARVFATFDIREHGTNKILASSFRAKLTDSASHEDGLTLTLQAPLPLVFVIVRHDDKGATAINHAPSEEQILSLSPGEYFAEASVGFHGGVVVNKKSLTISPNKDATCWNFRT